MSGYPSPLQLENDKQDAIHDEIMHRTGAHQLAVAQSPSHTLTLLACGDSWFDYPLDGLIFGPHTDVIAQLPDQCGSFCAARPNILSLAHYGYTSTQEMGYARQQRMLDAITNPLNGTFDGILFSGGGNDIAGDALCIWINDSDAVAGDAEQAINGPRFAGVLQMVSASFLELVAFRDKHLPGVPIFAHSYDFPYATGDAAKIADVPVLGPWLKPSLDYRGWTDAALAHEIMRELLLRFASMIDTLAANKENDIVHVRTQGTLTHGPSDWANELHPTPAGFRAIAKVFAGALESVWTSGGE